jgi:hypothetical protein
MDKGVHLLPFPYPFRAMLAVSNDIDNTSWDECQTIHKTFAKHGLPLADSMFAYQMPGAGEYAFSPLDYPSLAPSELAEPIMEMIRDGKIDTLHALGNHSATGGVRREISRRAAEIFIKEGITFRVWTNHGDRQNRQNITFGQGDSPGNPGYVADLLPPLGIRFLWTGDLTPFIGQARRLTLRDTYLNRRLYPSLFRRASGILRYLAKALVTRKAPLDQTVNQLIFPIELADNQIFWAFRRFGRWDRARRSDIPEIFSSENLERLSRNGGYMIVYIHLGKPKQAQGPSFSAAEAGALGRLGDYFRAGRILVTTTGRLLDYHVTHRFLSWQIDRTRDKTVIVIEGIKDPVFGNRAPDITDLAGITFSVPDVPRTVIELGGRRIEYHTFNRTRRDAGVIGITWPKEIDP